LTVSVLDGTALCVTEIKPNLGFYDFDAKYAAGGSEHVLPADVPKPVTLLACDWAERAYRHLGCRGVIRADYRWDEDRNQLYMLEINTVPGMTATSLVPEQARSVGMSGEELVNHLLETGAMRRLIPFLKSPEQVPRETPEGGVVRRPSRSGLRAILRGSLAISVLCHDHCRLCPSVSAFWTASSR
jgi:hypothetical protein